MNQAPTIFNYAGPINSRLGTINWSIVIYQFQELMPGQTHEDYLFTDSDGDELSYTVTSANSDIFEGSIVTIVNTNSTVINLYFHPKQVGTTTITLTATDGKGGSVSMIIPVVVTLAPSTITFAAAGPIAKTAGDPVFTNAVTGGAGTGTITYSSDNAAVATVDPAGEVTIVGAGTTVITATKAATATHAATIATYTVNVALAPIVLPTTIDPMFQNLTYNGTVAKTSGGLNPVAYQVTSGILPVGLTLNTSTGAITGTPTGTGAYDFTITATDSSPLPLIIMKAQQYTGEVKNPLVLHLKFEDTTNDSSGFGNDGTIMNPGNVSYVVGKVGKAIKFGGVNAVGSVEVVQNSSLALNDEITLAYWVRMDNHYGEFNNDNTFVSKGNHAVFVKGNEGSLSSYIYTGSGAADLWYQRVPTNNKISVNNSFTVGQWVHVAFTISPTQQKGYINGVEVTSNNLPTPVNLSTSNAGLIYIGWLNSSWYALDGAVDDFRMYNTALSASEILTLIQLGSI